VREDEVRRSGPRAARERRVRPETVAALRRRAGRRVKG
jgi:hypothetical protein